MVFLWIFLMDIKLRISFKNIRDFFLKKILGCLLKILRVFKDFPRIFYDFSKIFKVVKGF